MLSALSLAACYDASHVIIESDSKACIDSISSTRDTFPWRLNHFVEAIHVACFSLVSVSFGWIYREANMTAHELAK